MNNGVQFIKIDDEQAGQRIDNFLTKSCKGVPNSHIYKILRAGAVRVNKKRIEANYRLQSGDVLRIPPIRVAEAVAPIHQAIPESAFLPILFEDEALLIVNKPAGLAVHGGSGISFGVIEQLRHQRPQAKLLELVHRLDRETSGILVVAKKRSALVHLHAQWRAGAPQKQYLALIRGHLNNQNEDVCLPLYKYVDAKGERRVRVDHELGQAARTTFSVQESFSRFSLVKALLKTGRTHQIRVHLAALNTPILGDSRYGDASLNQQLLIGKAHQTPFNRMFLHASELRLIHPITLAAMTFKADLPDECERFLNSLRA